MNYFKHLFILFLSIVMLSCGGSKDSDKDNSNSNSDGKSEMIKDPKNACECAQMANQKMQTLANYSDEELKQNLNIYDEYKQEINETCEKFMDELKEKYKSRKEFEKDCQWVVKNKKLKKELQTRIQNLKENPSEKRDDSATLERNYTFDNACDCWHWMNDEIDKLTSMTIDDMAKNPSAGEDFERKVESNTRCKNLMDEIESKYDSPEEFMEECPMMKTVMDKAERLKSLEKD